MRSAKKSYPSSRVGMRWQFFVVAAVLSLTALTIRVEVSVQADDQVASADDVIFFEKHIRPVLVQECYECHSGNVAANQTGLRVDLAVGLVTGGGSGPSIVKGKPEESLLIKAFKYDTALRMPPGGKLSDETIANFEEWIRRGAPDTRTGNADATFGAREIDWKSEGSHWSYQPVQAPEVPTVQNESWSRTNYDRFILAQLERAGITPAADVEAEVWLRRVSFDLTGLPPTPGEILDFSLDSTPNARQKVVDRLLESPRFGERWGRHWLDVARFGESTGKERNFVYLQTWRYRDYVIDSFNRDKPYDQFLREQIAGDLIPHQNDVEKNEHHIATGFLAMNPKGLNDRNRESFLLDIIDEQIESICRGVLGLSVTCARCHDHKYDAISQADYFALGGIFRSTEPRFGMLSRTRFASDPDQLIPLAATEQTRGEAFPHELVAQFNQLEAEQASLNAQIAELRSRVTVEPPPIPTVQAVVAAAEEAALKKADDAAAAAGTNPRGRRRSDPKTPEEKMLVELEGQARGLTKKSTELQQQIFAITTNTAAIGLNDRSQPVDLAIRVKGEVDQWGATVPRGFLTVVLQHQNQPHRVGPTGSGRLELAQWIIDPQNPLTSRVYVNRVWSKLLGSGIVTTLDDFGVQGRNPSHPALLDYIATQFMRQRWSTKQLVREVALSRVYGLGTRVDQNAITLDGENRLLGRWNPRRLEAEILRDAILAVGGELNLTRPYGTPLLELGVREVGGRFDDKIVRNLSQHRSVYLPYMRSRVPEMLTLFDAANPGLTVGKRDVSAGPDQALYLLNSSFVCEESQRFARRLLQSSVTDDAARIDLAFRIALGSLPSHEQRQEALTFLREWELRAPNPSTPEKTVKEVPDARLAAWSTFSQALLALPEFRYLN